MKLIEVELYKRAKNYKRNRTQNKVTKQIESSNPLNQLNRTLETGLSSTISDW
ncbi:hypothetical protein LguiA_002672 [Lonicera macranthoides]